MYAQKKYSAQNRIETAQEWLHKYPDRQPIVMSSPHWHFYEFKCLLVPRTMTIESLCCLLYKKWKDTFPPNTHVILLTVGNTDQMVERSSTIGSVCTSHLHSDGLLYLSVRRLD